jgi:hypothetical protein
MAFPHRATQLENNQVAHYPQPLPMYNAKFQDLQLLVNALADDVAKADKGNNAAKVRIRKALQQVKATAQEFRLVLNEPLTSNDQL